MLPENSLSEDGYIINQGALSGIPFGAVTSRQGGCGWIAVFNLMKVLNMEKPYKEIISALTPYILRKGRLGTRMAGIKKYLRAQGCAMDTSFRTGRFAALAARSKGGIIYYGTAATYHFTAYQTLDDGKFRFFNAVYGIKEDVLTMQQFLQRVKRPLTHIVVVKEQ